MATFRINASFGRVAWQDSVMGADADFLGRLGPELQLVLPMLDERARRLVLGMAARAAGDGGTGAVAALTGASWQTVADGAAEVGSGDSAPPGARPAAGRRPQAAGRDRPRARAGAAGRWSGTPSGGDPQSPLEWTTKSVKQLAARDDRGRAPVQPADLLAGAEGRRVHHAVQLQGGRGPPAPRPRRPVPLHRRAGGRAPRRRAAGDQRGLQETRAGRRLRAERPRVARRQASPSWSPPTTSPARTSGHAIPYGVYDEDANTGFVNVGTDGNTAALAVESIRRWWNLVGKAAYPGATRLLVTCDSGGSNEQLQPGLENRAWRSWPPRPAWRSPSATSRPARPSGTRSSTGCSARSPSAGAAAP